VVHSWSSILLVVGAEFVEERAVPEVGTLVGSFVLRIDWFGMGFYF
jgi:hypothetical protein